MDDTLRGQVKAFALGRVGLGTAAVLAPRLVLRVLMGKHQGGPASRMLARMLGARDIALGLGVVLALDHDTPVRGWLEAGTVADTGDFAATLLAFRHLPRPAALANALASLGGAAYGRYLVSSLPPTESAQPPPEPHAVP